MIRTFCDFCEVEIRAPFVIASTDFDSDLADVRAAVTVNAMATRGDAGDGHICQHCIFNAVERILDQKLEDFTPVQLPADATRQRLIEEIGGTVVDAFQTGFASSKEAIDRLITLFDSPEYSPVTRAIPLGDVQVINFGSAPQATLYDAERTRLVSDLAALALNATSAYSYEFAADVQRLLTSPLYVAAVDDAVEQCKPTEAAPAPAAFDDDIPF